MSLLVLMVETGGTGRTMPLLVLTQGEREDNATASTNGGDRETGRTMSLLLLMVETGGTGRTMPLLVLMVETGGQGGQCHCYY